MSLVISRVQELKAAYAKPLSVWIGKSPAQWADKVQPGLAHQYGLSNTPLSRAQLKAMWANPEISTEACFLSTMAWGGMRAGHGRRVWASKADWLSLCRQLRAQLLSRSEAYAAFQKLSLEGKLPGMGPAYYTKLLYFAMPTTAYIMDQWTVRSVHYLTSQDRWPCLQKDYASAAKAKSHPGALRTYVMKNNNAEAYETYCQLVEQLALLLDKRPEDAEEMLFSQGGRRPHGWREKIMSAWSLSVPPFYA